MPAFTFALFRRSTTARSHIHTRFLHDALPISKRGGRQRTRPQHASSSSLGAHPRGKLVGVFFYGTEPDPPPYPLNKTGAAEIFGKYFRLARDVRVSDSVAMFAGMERWQEWQLRS